MAERDASNGRNGPHGGESGTDRFGWWLGAASAVTVAALIGYLVYEALSGPPPVTDLSVETKATVQRGADYYVDVVVRNSAGASAAGVIVEGTISRNSVPLETSQFRLDYVPAQSEAQGTLLFRHDPRSDRLELEVKSFSEP